MAFSTAYEIRLVNVRALVQHQGTETIYKAAHITKQQLSQYIGRKPTRNIGDDMARRIEKSCGLERGWLDNVHAAQSTELHDILEILNLYADGDMPAVTAALTQKALARKLSKSHNPSPPLKTKNKVPVNETPAHPVLSPRKRSEGSG